ncbi:MAG: hypothetical protein U0L12_11400 [Ruminococcus sp.]|nr:hypothetical protein [Ruminococcus sp.]
MAEELLVDKKKRESYNLNHSESFVDFIDVLFEKACRMGYKKRGGNV